MVRLPLMIAARRLLWLAPLIILLIVVFAVYATPGPALAGYSVTAFAFVGLGVWLTVAVGSCDDDAHRELMAARLGSVRRVHAGRAVAALVFVAIADLWCTTMPLMAGTLRFRTSAGSSLPSDASILLAGSATHLAFALLGVAFGTFLHRPLVVRPAFSVMVGIGATSLIPVTPPLLAVLKQLNHDRISAVPVLLVVSAAICGVAVGSASGLAARR